MVVRWLAAGVSQYGLWRGAARHDCTTVAFSQNRETILVFYIASKRFFSICISCVDQKGVYQFEGRKAMMGEEQGGVASGP